MLQYFKGLSVLHIVSMLYIRWRTQNNMVVMNFVKHGCLLNESTCKKGIQVKPVNKN